MFLSAIADLGCFEVVPNVDTHMKGCIALSRVTDADSLLIAQPFSPKLFAQGPQPFPTLLLKVLRNEVDEPAIPAACLNIQAELTARRSPASTLKLKNMTWTRCLCSEAKNWKAFVSENDYLT